MQLTKVKKKGSDTMQFISELKELVGKTIKSAEFIPYNERLAIVFENDACM